MQIRKELVELDSLISSISGSTRKTGIISPRERYKGYSKDVVSFVPVLRIFGFILLGCLAGIFFGSRYSSGKPLENTTLPTSSQKKHVSYDLTLLDHWSISPEHKLMICRIEQNGFEHLTRIVNKLNHFKNSEPDIWYSSSFADDGELGIPISDFKSMLADESWIKIVFLRDPIERFVMSYLAKCIEPKENEGEHCPHHPVFGKFDKIDVPFYRFVDRMVGHEHGKQWLRRFTKIGDFRPQYEFCGNLLTISDHLSYVGYINGLNSVDEHLLKITEEFPSLHISEKDMRSILRPLQFYKVNPELKAKNASKATMTEDLEDQLRELYSEDFDLIYKLVPKQGKKKK